LKKQTTLSERIKALRKEKNMTQLELAAKLNITDKAVSKWEAAEGNPDITLLAKLGEIFGVTIDYLLTGKEPEEKIVVMSKAELCARNDDVYLLDEIMQSKALPDEKGATVLDYALKYTSIKVFKELSDRGFNYLEGRRASPRSMFGPEPYIPSNAKDMMRMYMLSGCLGNLPQLGIKPITQWTLLEWNEEMFNLVLGDALPSASKDIIFGMHEQEGEGRSKSPSGIITGAQKQAVVNWPIVYSKLMEMAVLEDRMPQAAFIQELISSINEKVFCLVEECLEKKKPYIHFTNIEPADINDEKVTKKRFGNVESFVRSVSAKQQYEYSSNYSPNTGIKTSRLYSVTYSKLMLDRLLNEDIERVKTFNENNKKTGGFHFTDKEIEIARMKNEKAHTPDEIFVFSCIEYGILNIEKLLESKNLQLIKKTLYSYPIHYFEILKKIIENDDYKTMFRKFVDIGYVGGADELLLEHSYIALIYKHINRVYDDKIYRTEVEKRAINFINNTMRGNANHTEHINETTKSAIAIQEANLAYLAKNYRKNMSAAGLYDDITRSYRITDSNQLMSFLDECRAVIIQELSGKIDKQQLEQALNREYFMTNIAKKETDIAIIKLTQLLEGKLKVDYQLSGELKDMIDAYCRERCYGDDGWGYTIQKDQKTPDLLHRLRIMRNNLVHSETNKVNALSEQELIECIDLVLKM